MEIREIQENEMDQLLGLYAVLHTCDDPRPEKSVVESTWKEIIESPYFTYFGVFEDPKREF